MVLVGVPAVLIGKATPISTEFPNAYIDHGLDACDAAVIAVRRLALARSALQRVVIAAEALVSDLHPRAERTDSRKSSPAKRMASASVAKRR